MLNLNSQVRELRFKGVKYFVYCPLVNTVLWLIQNRVGFLEELLKNTSKETAYSNCYRSFGPGPNSSVSYVRSDHFPNMPNKRQVMVEVRERNLINVAPVHHWKRKGGHLTHLPSVDICFRFK
jgi:hypothetical protein